MAFVQEWIRPTDRELTADQVKKLDLGTKVTVISADRHGECQRGEYKIVYSGKRKILIIHDYYGGISQLPIRDYPNKRYVIPRGPA